LIDLVNDTFKLALFTAGSNAGNSALTHSGGTPPLYTDLTNQVSNANGYTTGGVTCAATWTNSSGTQTLDLADAQWTASGSGLTFEYGVLYDSTSGHLVGWFYFDSTPTSVSVSAGVQMTAVIDAAGFFTLA
jgi:hypothetical protein